MHGTFGRQQKQHLAGRQQPSTDRINRGGVPSSRTEPQSERADTERCGRGRAALLSDQLVITGTWARHRAGSSSRAATRSAYSRVLPALANSSATPYVACSSGSERTTWLSSLTVLSSGGGVSRCC